MALHLRLARLESDAATGAENALVPTVLEAFRVRTPGDVLELLERQIMAVAGDTKARAVERARTIGFLASLTLKAIEASNFAARLEALETVLKRRTDNPTDTP